MMKVKAEKYHHMKEEMEKMGMMGMSMMPVDMNGAYVSMDVTPSSKNSDAELQMANHCNLERFGLTENGC